MMSKAEVTAKTEAVFNAASDHFDAPALSFWNRFGQRTIDHLNLQPGDRVLDICCGTGASAIPAAKAVGPTGQVLGVDLAAALLQLAQQKTQQQGLQNLEFRQGDFEALGLPDERFDAIVCVFGIFFVPDMIAALRELWRMLRPGGKLAITSWGEQVFTPASQQFWQTIEVERPDLVKHVMPWDRISEPATLQDLLETAGITQVEVVAETGTHALESAEDWWTIVMGGGYRGTIDQLGPAARERVRAANLQILEAGAIQDLAVTVLYAIAQKP